MRLRRGWLAAASAVVLGITGCGGSTAGTGGTTTTTVTGGLLSFEASAEFVYQSGGTAYFMVQRTGSPTGAVSALYQTGDGTGKAGTSYTASTGTLSWTDGDSSVKTVAVPILTKSPAATTTFNLTLSGVTGGAGLGPYPSTIVSIIDTYTPPSTLKNFNLAPWKLQLPIDEYRETDNTYGAWGISTSDILGGFADDFFYASGSSIVFVAPATGATTTPGSGSDHTRSELRELYTGAGTDSNSDWTNTIGGTQTGTCVVNSVASSSDEATFAQIHGQNNTFVLLEYRTANSSIAMVTYDANATSSTTTTTTILTGVAVGTTLNYTLKYDNTNTLTATVNGVTKTVTAGSTWIGQSVYFKAGAYHAAPDTGAGTTQVTYSALSVSH